MVGRGARAHISIFEDYSRLPGGLGPGILVDLLLVGLLAVVEGEAVFWLTAKPCGAELEFKSALRATAACQELVPVHSAFNLFHMASLNLGLGLAIF